MTKIRQHNNLTIQQPIDVARRNARSDPPPPSKRGARRVELGTGFFSFVDLLLAYYNVPTQNCIIFVWRPLTPSYEVSPGLAHSAGHAARVLLVTKKPIFWPSKKSLKNHPLKKHTFLVKFSDFWYFFHSISLIFGIFWDSQEIIFRFLRRVNFSVVFCQFFKNKYEKQKTSEVRFSMQNTVFRECRNVGKNTRTAWTNHQNFH